jgi:hypothetical protein
METLATYLSLGWEHIVSGDALDHQLFLLALVLPFSIQQYRKILILITAFTIGHSLTLALCSSGQIRLSPAYVEFLIPVSIFITAILQWWKSSKTSSFSAMFGLAGIFGLLHGMGFANTLRSMLGREESLLMPLGGFNLGVELGQIALVLLILGFRYLLAKMLPSSESMVCRLILVVVLLGSFWMIWERMPLIPV